MTIYYPDVSSHNPGVSLTGALIVAIKSTEGTSYLNPEWMHGDGTPGRQQTEAARVGAFTFAYHFLLQGSAAAQAAWCFAKTGKVPVMVDFEPVEPPDGSSYPSLADCITFIDAYRKLGGVTHLVYLPHWYWSRKTADRGLGSPSLQPLIDRKMQLVSSAYVAYTDAAAGTGWQPYGGMTPLVWQYTDRLQFNGMLLDFNAFRGSFAGKQDPASVTACLAEFKAFATTGAPPPHGPYLHEVRPGDPAQSFAALAASRGMTVDRLAQIARGVLAGKDLAIFNAYLALDAALTAAGRPHPVMPAGFVWVSVNP